MSERIWLASLCLVATVVPACAIAATFLDKEEGFRQLHLRSGRWQTTIRIDSVEVTPTDPAGAISPDTRASLEGQVGRTFETEDCIGAGLAANGDLILPGIKIGAECPIDRFDVGSGRLTLAATCASRQIEMVIDGTFADEAMNGTVENLVRSDGSAVKMKLSTTSRYAGQCIAD